MHEIGYAGNIRGKMQRRIARIRCHPIRTDDFPTQTMYAVIFRAELTQGAKLDPEYQNTATRMRELAREKYGCLEFIMSTQDNEELAISYWKSTECIAAWRNNAEHKRAQKLGKERWYSWHKVQVAEVLREYEAP